MTPAFPSVGTGRAAPSPPAIGEPHPEPGDGPLPGSRVEAAIRRHGGKGTRATVEVTGRRDNEVAGARVSRRGLSLRHDRGSGTVWVVALMALVWLVAVVAMSAGGVRAARHRAHAAADLAALAAASHALEGTAKACGLAAVIARAAHGRLTECVLRADVAGVTVVATSRVPGLGSFHVTAVARAGPARPPATRSATSGVTVRSGRWGSGAFEDGRFPSGHSRCYR